MDKLTKNDDCTWLYASADFWEQVAAVRHNFDRVQNFIEAGITDAERNDHKQGRIDGSMYKKQCAGP